MDRRRDRSPHPGAQAVIGDETDKMMAQIDSLDDQITLRIKSLAVMFKGRVSVRLAVAMDQDRDFVFGKLDGAWQFIIETDDGAHSVISGSREERTEAFEWIGKLIEAAPNQLSQMIAPRINAVTELDRMIELLAGKPSTTENK